jgi:hypothetical protein
VITPVLSVMAVMASLVISTVALANSIKFEQSSYAVDNCDATSTCENEPGTGTGNSQTNTCTDFSTCSNGVFGDDSDRNTQTNGCTDFSTCRNDAGLGDGNTQNLLCARMTDCHNVIGSFEAPANSETQSTTCANAGSCSNVGENTNVLANGADCESHDTDATTYCQPNRIIIRPNP